MKPITLEQCISIFKRNGKWRTAFGKWFAQGCEDSPKEHQDSLIKGEIIRIMYRAEFYDRDDDCFDVFQYSNICYLRMKIKEYADREDDIWIVKILKVVERDGGCEDEKTLISTLHRDIKKGGFKEIKEEEMKEIYIVEGFYTDENGIARVYRQECRDYHVAETIMHKKCDDKKYFSMQLNVQKVGKKRNMLEQMKKEQE